MQCCFLPVHSVHHEGGNCIVCPNIGRTLRNDVAQTQKQIFCTYTKRLLTVQMFVHNGGEVFSGLKLILHVSLQWVEVNPRQKLTLMRIASCHLIRFLPTTRLILRQVGSNIACPVSLQTKSIRKVKNRWNNSLCGFTLFPSCPPVDTYCWFTVYVANQIIIHIHYVSQGS